MGLAAKDRAAAERYLASAVASLGTVTAKDEFVIPPPKKMAALTLPDQDAPRQNAMALAEIARLEAGLGKVEVARKHLSLAMSVLRAAAPTVAAARQQVEEAAALKVSQLEEPIPPKTASWTGLR